jgi:hypothetical protein
MCMCMVSKKILDCEDMTIHANASSSKVPEEEIQELSSNEICVSCCGELRSSVLNELTRNILLPEGQISWVEVPEELIGFSEKFIVFQFGIPSQKESLGCPSFEQDPIHDLTSHDINIANHQKNSDLKVSPLIGTKTSINVTLREFIRLLVKKMRLNAMQFMLGVYYLYRLKTRNRGLEGDIRVVAPRLFLVAMMSSTKFTLDHAYLNRVWAKVCGIYTISAVNQMEAEFLKYLEYRLAVDTREFIEFIYQTDRSIT